MAKGKLKKKFYNKDLELITDKTERFIVLVNDFKQNMGAWYSIFALRIVPILLYLIPVNVVLARFTLFYKNHYQPDFNWDGPILMVLWAIAIALLIVLVILLPKAATVFEFFFGFAYLFFVLKNHLYNRPVGVALLICMIIYLLVKLFFLIVEIMSKVKFSGDKANNIERDETGRIVRAAGEDVLFIKSDDREEIDKNRPSATADNDFLFEKTSEDTSQAEAAAARMAYDDDFFVGKVDDTPPEEPNTAYNDDVFFVKEDKKPKIDKNATISENDNDYFFG